MIILGISAFYHDSAACLCVDGKILSAVQEERFTRKKNDNSFPINSINYCLNNANVNYKDINHVVFYEKPFAKFERIFETYLAFAPKGFSGFSKSLPLWVKEKLFQKSLICSLLKKNICKNVNWKNKILFSDHHLSHASSAFFPSPYENAAILTMDGVGEWSTTSLSTGSGNKINTIKEINFPHSIGLFYSAFTYYAGFKVNSGEYKLMGLAPYGEPIYCNLIKDNIINIADDGSFNLNMSYFDYCTGDNMLSKKFNSLFGRQPRKKNEHITKLDIDLAASVQKITEEVVLKLVKNIRNETEETNLCLAGGVALNCVANGKILDQKIFENIWCQPAAGDAGGAIGAALAVHYLMLKNERNIGLSKDDMNYAYLGPEYSDLEIEEKLKEFGCNFKKFSDAELVEYVALKINEQKIIGWMQGRMEFGPRALGNRSILADPRSSKMQKVLNLKIKNRESFRPFAPSILFENLEEWFDVNKDDPYMLFVSKIKQDKLIQLNEREKSLNGIEKLNVVRSSIPAVTHVDNSARVHTVTKISNQKFYSLLMKFNELTGCPILINTSFNIRGEPIVCSIEDAFSCYMNTEIDMLVIGNYILEKNSNL